METTQIINTTHHALTSTSEVYGKNAAVPFTEESDLVMGATTRGRWSYACSKAIDEFLAIAYWREKRLPTVVVRLFNTVGPRQTGQYGMVIPRFVTQALEDEPITVYGDGKQVRDIPFHCLSLSPALPQLDRRLLRVLLCAALGARRPNRGVEQRNHHLGFPPRILDRSHHESWPGGTRCRVVTDPPRAKTGCLDKQSGTRDGRGLPRLFAPQRMAGFGR